MERINIEFTLFSAFYSPLISVMSGGFLKAEGLEAAWTVSPPGVSAVMRGLVATDASNVPIDRLGIARFGAP